MNMASISQTEQADKNSNPELGLGFDLIPNICGKLTPGHISIYRWRARNEGFITNYQFHVMQLKCIIH
jgi:hypothetical protein